MGNPRSRLIRLDGILLTECDFLLSLKLLAAWPLCQFFRFCFASFCFAYDMRVIDESKLPLLLVGAFILTLI